MGYGAMPHQSKAVDRLVGGFGGAIPRHGIKQLIGGGVSYLILIQESRILS